MALLPDIVPAGSVELRRWSPTFAAPLCEAVTASLPELRPWMPWAQEAPTVADMIQVLARGAADFTEDREWPFVVAEPGTDRILGACGLHPRGVSGTIEIGYWIRTDATGGGRATAVSRALTTAAFAHLPDVETVEIRMDRANGRSAAVPPRLRFRLRTDVDHPVDTPGQSARTSVWVMARADWDPSTA